MGREIQALWLCGSALPWGDPKPVEEGSSPKARSPLGSPRTQMLLRFLIPGDW